MWRVPLLYPRPNYLPAVPPPLDRKQLGAITGWPFAEGPLADGLADTTPLSLANALESVEGPFVFGLPTRGHVFLSEAEHVHEVLVTKAHSFVKGEQEIALSASIGWGLLTDEGPSHRASQQSLGPGFRQEAMEAYMAGAWANAERSLESLGNQSGIGLVEWSRRYSQAAGEALLLPSSQELPDFAFQEKLFSLNAMTVMPPGSSSREALSLAGVKGYFSERDWILGYVDGLLAKRTYSPQASGLWDMFLGSEKESSSSLAQAVLFLGAATETTGSLIAWISLALSRNPKYWTMLAEEARRINPQTSDYRQIGALPWHKAVISESLRLYPPTWLLPRIAIEPVEIAGVTLPEGAHVWVSPWVSHRRNGLFDQPDLFRPERWLEGASSLPGGSYFPFGLGSRICIGERFSKMTTTVLLLSIVRSGYRLNLSESSDALGSAHVITNPKTTIEVSLERE